MGKRTVIAADEELLVQGRLTVTGNVTQVESTQIVNRLESDELVINADGVDDDNAETTAKLILKSNTTQATISYNHTAGVIVIDKSLTADIVGNVTGDVYSSNGTKILEAGTNGTDAVLTGTVSSISNHTTAGLPEGAGSLYYTTNRANADFDTRLATKNTANLAEGTNLYYTQARADARVNAQTGSNLDLSQKTTSDLAEGAKLYYTQGRFDIAFGNKTTADLNENTNLYHTTARARAAVSVTDLGGDGSLSYDSSTGVITYTGPSASEVRAHLSASGDIAYNSSTGVISFTERTDAEVRGLVSHVDAGGDGSFAYNNSTGVFTYTGQNDSEFFQHLENAGTMGELSYDSTNKFRVGSAFFTGKPIVASLDLDSDKILILDATDGLIKQSNISTLATAAAGVGNTAKLLAFIGL